MKIENRFFTFEIKNIEAVDTFSNVWRYWSIKVATLGSVLMAAFMVAPEQIQWVWEHLPEDLKGRMPEDFGVQLAFVLFVLNFLVRIIKQTPRDSNDE